MQADGVELAGRVILLVDDEALVRIGTALMLEELDCHVVQASTAAQGLQLLAENDDIEIVITDFRMPDMDGLAMIERARQARPKIKAILMTGYSADDERFSSLDFPQISKPFGLGELETALAQSA
jgi:CheY-like chemotaxis protein